MSDDNSIKNTSKFFGTRPDGTAASKKGIGAPWPNNAIAASPGLTRIEPFLTPSKFKKRFLFGIPLTSPITKETLGVEDFKDMLQRAANQFEMDSRVNINPVVKRWRLPFDPNMYYQFIYLECPDKPIQHVLNLSICSASYTQTGERNEGDPYPRGAEIYTIPLEWIETGNALRGIINVNPINPAFSAIGTNSGITASGATILQFIGQQGWVPAYWNVEALVGMGSKDGGIPVVINEAVGLRATMMFLDLMIPQFRFTSQSLNIDGEGQSVSDNLYALLQAKRQAAEVDYKKIVEKIKAITSSKVYSSNV